jgi:hypothetical protein
LVTIYARVEQILVAPQDQNRNGIGCDYHPSVATHAIFSMRVAMRAATLATSARVGVPRAWKTSRPVCWSRT